tara:strand:- start:88299 stop:88751 length:453 start_codon:yes stop_codon:yes gene_type:complete
MPRMKSLGGVKGEIKALEIITLNKPVTPQEIEDYVGTGPYASKYIFILRRKNFIFDTTKDGRVITSYILVAEPENAAEIRATQPKVPKVKAAAKKKDFKVLIGGDKLKYIPSKVVEFKAKPTNKYVPEFDGEVEEDFDAIAIENIRALIG